MAAGGPGVVEIDWVANPFRGDDFESIWRPVAEACLRYGASAYVFLRSKEDLLQFKQVAYFDSKVDFDRYWQSAELSEARAVASGMFQLPVLPVWHSVVASGMLAGLQAGDRVN